MSGDISVWESVQRFIGMESSFLDAKDWDSWLNLYLPEAQYWIPSWRSDGKLVTDPKKELSLIYYPNRVGLEGRVFRIRTGRASSTVPAPRTSHVNQLLDIRLEEDIAHVRSNWMTSSIAEGHVANYFGCAEYVLRPDAGSWKILSKKTILMNDMIHEVLDFYNV
jgi:benzoate/toluate 1,2-dioxygenase beta subunit